MDSTGAPQCVDAKEHPCAAIKGHRRAKKIPDSPPPSFREGTLLTLKTIIGRGALSLTNEEVRFTSRVRPFLDGIHAAPARADLDSEAGRALSAR